MGPAPFGDNPGRSRFRDQTAGKETPMSMSKTDLEKNRGIRINGKVGATAIPGRFAGGAASAVDKREQRRQDRASGQIPFACKLPAELVKQLQERGMAHEGGINAFVAELIAKALTAA
jgi:hypothetical protein